MPLSRALSVGSRALAGLLSLVSAQAPARAQPPPADSTSDAVTVFVHATVVDVERGRLLTDRTVVVAGRRITRVAPTASAAAPPSLPAGARVVDASGLYVIPGLWDMHVHAPGGPPGDAMARRLFFPLYLANGVTGVRHMFGTAAELRQRDDVARGRVLAPRMVVGSPLVDGPRPMWGGSVAVGTAADAARAVDSLTQRGYAFIKAYQFLPRDAYLGLLAAAKRRGVPVAGHVPLAVSVREAADAGQRSIEHASGLLLACSAREAALRPVLEAAAAIDTGFAAHAALWARAETEPAASFDRAKCATLARRLARRGTYVVPSLVLHRALASMGDSAWRASAHNRARAPYLPPFFQQFWAGTAGAYPGYGAAYARHRDATAVLRQAGVPLLAGTDVMNPYVYPGFSLHDELALLQDAGLSPLEALRTATLNPARFFGATDTLGTVAPGKVADLVLLAADPLSDVRNAAQIRAVIANGRYLDRARIDALLEGVRRTATSPAPGSR
jgi:imidazolonepropionase-like amidohydrolase